MPTRGTHTKPLEIPQKKGDVMPEIVIEHLSKVFTTKDGNVEALRDVNISIDKGDIFGIIGMSGAGKSTLVRCMNFLEQPTEGKVMIEGNPLEIIPRKNYRRSGKKSQ